MLSFPLFSLTIVKIQISKYYIMDDHSGPKHTFFRIPPPPTVIQCQPVFISHVSSSTTEASPAMVIWGSNDSFIEE